MVISRRTYDDIIAKAKSDGIDVLSVHNNPMIKTKTYKCVTLEVAGEADNFDTHKNEIYSGCCELADCVAHTVHGAYEYFKPEMREFVLGYCPEGALEFEEDDEVELSGIINTEDPRVKLVVGSAAIPTKHYSRNHQLSERVVVEFYIIDGESFDAMNTKLEVDK